MLARLTKPVAEALFSTPDGPAPAARVTWLIADFEDFVERSGPRAELLLRGALLLANFAAPLGLGRRPPLERLDLPARCEALERLERTPAGLPLLALKVMLCTLYFEHPDVVAELGLDHRGVSLHRVGTRGADS